MSGRYVRLYMPKYPRAYAYGCIFEHVVVAEKALGKPLPPGAEIHHVNENRADNRHRNLVVCESYAYHALLHQRTRAFRECGHAGWLKCRYCKTYDAPENLYVEPHRRRGEHRSCKKERYGSGELNPARGEAR